MTYRNDSAASKIAANFLVFTSASIAFLGCVTALPANAYDVVRPQPKEVSADLKPDPETDPDADVEEDTDDDPTTENTSVAIKSPTLQQGTQHTSASSPGGATAVQNGYCKKVRVCNIHQHVIVVAPGGSAEAVQNARTGDPDKSTTTDLTPGGAADGAEEESYDTAAAADAPVAPQAAEAGPAVEDYTGPAGFMMALMTHLDEHDQGKAFHDVSPMPRAEAPMGRPEAPRAPKAGYQESDGEMEESGDLPDRN